MFNWATGQQAGFIGGTTEQLQVSLCPSGVTCPSSDIMKTIVRTTPQGGFDPWEPGSFTFTPTKSSEVLTFLGIGTPERGVGNGGPPFILLESPSLRQQAVPEPGTWLLLGIGFAAIVGGAYGRPKWLCVPD